MIASEMSGQMAVKAESTLHNGSFHEYGQLLPV